LFDFFSLDFVYYPVSWIMWAWYKLFAALLGPSSFFAWALSVMFLVFTLRALLYKPFVRQIRTTRQMQELQPQIKALQKKYGKDLVVIGVSDEDPQKVAKFMKTTPMNYYVAIDRSHNLYRQIGIQSIPHALVITPDHIVRWQGFPDLRGDILTEEVMANIIATSKRSTVAMRR